MKYILIIAMLFACSCNHKPFDSESKDYSENPFLKEVCYKGRMFIMMGNELHGSLSQLFNKDGKPELCGHDEKN